MREFIFMRTTEESAVKHALLNVGRVPFSLRGGSLKLSKVSVISAFVAHVGTGLDRAR